MPPCLSRTLKALLVLAVVALAGFVLHRILSRYSLDEIAASVSAIPTPRLLLAGVFAAMSYLCLTGFDYLALHYVGRPLPYRQAALASFVSLSLGHNIGIAALSSGAIRYRFYSRWGLSGGEVAKVILFCALTVGLGLLVLGACALLIRPDIAGQIIGVGRLEAIALGAACAALAAGYLAAAAYIRHPLRIGRWSLELPPPRIALAQLVIGPLDFAFVAACLHQAILGVADVGYFAVACAYVLGNVASLISHVPGGLGVLESVVMFLLGNSGVIGALLVFRVVYFLVPLAIGSSLFALVELKGLLRSGRVEGLRRAADGRRLPLQEPQRLERPLGIEEPSP
jgi:uncharacterized membrane protein YbhN (UPF0104 family)